MTSASFRLGPGNQTPQILEIKSVIWEIKRDKYWKSKVVSWEIKRDILEIKSVSVIWEIKRDKFRNQKCYLRNQTR